MILRKDDEGVHFFDGGRVTSMAISPNCIAGSCVPILVIHEGGGNKADGRLEALRLGAFLIIFVLPGLKEYA